jgi:hypothetical protein
MADTQNYRLKQGTERVTRAGLHLERGNTVELTEEQYHEHDDVLEPAGGTGTDDVDEEASE